jgi:hypothetical protein
MLQRRPLVATAATAVVIFGCASVLRQQARLRGPPHQRPVAAAHSPDSSRYPPPPPKHTHTLPRLSCLGASLYSCWNRGRNTVQAPLRCVATAVARCCNQGSLTIAESFGSARQRGQTGQEATSPGGGGGGGTALRSDADKAKKPIKIEPKTFFANERTLLQATPRCNIRHATATCNVQRCSMRYAACSAHQAACRVQACERVAHSMHADCSRQHAARPTACY